MATGHARDDGALAVAFVRGVLPGKWQRIWDERNPDRPLQLTSVEEDEQLDALASGEADMAFVRLPIDVDPDSFHVVPLYEELAVALVSADDDLSAADDLGLADLDGAVVHPPATGPSLLDTVEVVRAGVGVIVLPQSVARIVAGKGLEWRVLRDAPTTRIALVWPRPADDADPVFTDDLQDFVGVVRGRKANSSRGRQPDPEPEPPKKRREPPKPPKRTTPRVHTPRGKRSGRR